MAPLIETMPSGIKVHYEMNKPNERQLSSGEAVELFSTPKGGFIRREYPESDQILPPGEVVQLANGSFVQVIGQENQNATPNPQIDGVV